MQQKPPPLQWVSSSSYVTLTRPWWSRTGTGQAAQLQSGRRDSSWKSTKDQLTGWGGRRAHVLKGSVAETEEAVATARVVAAVEGAAREGGRAGVDINVIEAEARADDLLHYRRDDRVGDEVAVDAVPVQRMLVVLEPLGAVVLPATLALVRHGLRTGGCSGRSLRVDAGLRGEAATAGTGRVRGEAQRQRRAAERCVLTRSDATVSASRALRMTI